MNVIQLVQNASMMDLDLLCKEVDRVTEKYPQDPHLYLLYLIVGTLMYTKANKKANDKMIKKANDKMIGYLQESMRMKPVFMNQYQLAFVLEESVRASRETKDSECKQMITLYLACEHEEAKAACQLGSYLIDFPKDLQYVPDCKEDDNNLAYAEMLLLSAHQRKIPQAVIHLIRVYKRRNAIDKVAHFMKLKYLQTRDMMDLMELSLLLLNSADYFAYCKTMKELGQRVSSVKMFLKPGTFGVCAEKQECCVCLEKLRDTLQLACKHHVCDKCLLEMFENELRLCPLCRSELCPAQSETAKTCISNMMANDSMTKFTHSFTVSPKKL